MITISKEQMAKAEVKYRIRFYKRIRAFVREKMPKETAPYPDSKLLAYIAEQDKIAGAFGIITDQGVTKWVCLSLDLGKNFYQKESVQKYFNPQNLPDSETKLHIFVEFLTAKQTDPDLKIETVIAKHGYLRIGG